MGNKVLLLAIVVEAGIVKLLMNGVDIDVAIGGILLTVRVTELAPDESLIEIPLREVAAGAVSVLLIADVIPEVVIELLVLPMTRLELVV